MAFRVPSFRFPVRRSRSGDLLSAYTNRFRLLGLGSDDAANGFLGLPEGSTTSEPRLTSLDTTVSATDSIGGDHSCGHFEQNFSGGEMVLRGMVGRPYYLDWLVYVVQGFSERSPPPPLSPEGP